MPPSVVNTFNKSSRLMPGFYGSGRFEYTHNPLSVFGITVGGLSRGDGSCGKQENHCENDSVHSISPDSAAADGLCRSRGEALAGVIAPGAGGIELQVSLPVFAGFVEGADLLAN